MKVDGSTISASKNEVNFDKLDPNILTPFMVYLHQKPTGALEITGDTKDLNQVFGDKSVEETVKQISGDARGGESVSEEKTSSPGRGPGKNSPS